MGWVGGHAPFILTLYLTIPFLFYMHMQLVTNTYLKDLWALDLRTTPAVWYKVQFTMTQVRRKVHTSTFPHLLVQPLSVK